MRTCFDRYNTPSSLYLHSITPLELRSVLTETEAGFDTRSLFRYGSDADVTMGPSTNSLLRYMTDRFCVERSMKST